MESRHPDAATRIRITGQVQGVSYRMWAQQSARALELVGWVRNEPDGWVLACVEGDADAVARFVEQCAEGPRFARVASVETSTVPALGARSFDVRG